MTVTRQDWTPARISELTALWAAGYTSNKIAEMMGLPGGKNAVVGKAHRLNLPPRKKPFTRSREEYKRAREERSAAKALRDRTRRPRISPSSVTPRVVVPPVAPPAEPVSRKILFAKRLTGMECAWIAGEPTFDATCCGHPCRAKSQFCEYHHSRVWHKAERK